MASTSLFFRSTCCGWGKLWFNKSLNLITTRYFWSANGRLACRAFLRLVRFSKSLLVGDQLDTHFFYIIRLFQSSTCFEQARAHHQELNCINAASGIVTLCKWPSGMRDGHLQRMTILDAELIKSTSSWWARVCSKHVEDWNKRII